MSHVPLKPPPAVVNLSACARHGKHALWLVGSLVPSWCALFFQRKAGTVSDACKGRRAEQPGAPGWKGQSTQRPAAAQRPRAELAQPGADGAQQGLGLAARGAA